MEIEGWNGWKHNDKGRRLCPLCGKASMGRARKSNSETDRGERLYSVGCKSCHKTVYETRHSDLSVKHLYHWKG